jgi:predicted CoA-binding protein
VTLLDRAEQRRRLLESITDVAIVGVSDDSRRPSHEVAEYAISSTGWRVWLVNPNHNEVLDRRVYPSLSALPVVPDLVDVFRRVEHLAEVTDEAIAVGAKALWFQLGLVDHASARRAAEAGLDVVQDRCLMVDHIRLVGPLHDFDTFEG